MKNNQFKVKSIAAFTAALALVFATSCTKDEVNDPINESPAQQAISKPVTDKVTQDQIREMVGQMPKLAVYNTTMETYVVLDLNNPKNGFDFSSPSGGASFSGPSGSAEFVPGPDGGYTIIATPSEGGGGGGGVVTAGSVSLNVNYVLCFASGDEAAEVNFFEIDGPIEGFSGAIGVAGNFEALQTEEFDESTDPLDFFQGMVFYYAYDGTASGNYDVIDFFSLEELNESDFNNKGYAVLISFQDNGGMFFALDGTLNFSGGSVGFNGTYAGITDFFFDLDEEFEDSEPNYVEVSGAGVLQCN